MSDGESLYDSIKRAFGLSEKKEEDAEKKKKEKQIAAAPVKPNPIIERKKYLEDKIKEAGG